MWKGNRTRMTGSTGSAGFMKGGKVSTFLNLPEPFLKDWITGQARGDTVFSLGIVCFGTCCLFQIDWIQAQTVPEGPQSARDDAVTNFSGIVSGLSAQLSQCRIRSSMNGHIHLGWPQNLTQIVGAVLHGFGG